MKKLASTLPALLLLTACESNTTSGQYIPPPVFDRAKIDSGFRVYVMHCQRCHGVNGVGAPNWREAGSDGKYPPPPLNGTGHTWHHPMPLLRQIIVEGTQPKGNMPAWGDTLSEKDVTDVITWFQSLWRPQVYYAWKEINDRAGQ